MRIIFAGTPTFAIPALEALLNSSHEICAVYTQPDRPAGRGKKLTSSPIKDFALDHKLPLYQPINLKDPDAQKELQNLNADILVNVAYGLLLPEPILNGTKFGCVNIHPSLLPRWRGAAPIQRAIMAGDTTTAATIMEMDIGLDTGDIYKQETLPITGDDTTKTLMAKTAEIGARLLLKVLSEIENGTATTTKQDDNQSTYANKITKEEAKIDWNKSATEIERMVRAFNPWPITYTELDGKQIRIWQAKVIAMQTKPDNEPGTIIQADKNGINVATGDDVLCLLKIQLPGGKSLPAQDILNAHKKDFAVGKKLGL